MAAKQTKSIMIYTDLSSQQQQLGILDQVNAKKG